MTTNQGDNMIRVTTAGSPQGAPGLSVTSAQAQLHVNEDGQLQLTFGGIEEVRLIYDPDTACWAEKDSRAGWSEVLFTADAGGK
mgnify:CR=1 FL=1